ncbi:MAG: hypothetical protein WCF65_09765, partial [Parachlamydiaceae bacterium]
ILAAVVSISFSRMATASFRFCLIVCGIMSNLESMRIPGTVYSINIRLAHKRTLSTGTYNASRNRHICSENSERKMRPR